VQGQQETLSRVEAPEAAERFQKWRRWQALGEQPAGLDDWTATHLDVLCRLEAEAPAAVAGRTLLHMDLRADNILLTSEGARFFDWPWSVGAAWVDLLLVAPSVEMQGGPAAPEVFGATAAGVKAPPEAVAAALASFTGMLTYSSLQQPPPPGLPTPRASRPHRRLHR